MRTIVREPGFDDRAVAVVGTIQLADQALEGLEWALGREDDFTDPDVAPRYHLFGQTKYGPLLAFKTPPIGRKADICLLVHFTYSESEIHLRAIAGSAPADDDHDDGE